MSATLTDLRNACESVSDRGAEYDERMMHRIPLDAPVVSRFTFLRDRCRDKCVLSLGCIGPGQDVIDEVAAECYTIDREPVARERHKVMDLDKCPPRMPGQSWGIDLIVASEIVEHLLQPGRVLRALRTYGVPLIVTVPNACGYIMQYHAQRGVENVNVDHVAWYTWRTMTTLLHRTGWQVDEFYWNDEHGGYAPPVTEGLIFVAR